jgi:hypothetical protein
MSNLMIYSILGLAMVAFVGAQGNWPSCSPGAYMTFDLYLDEICVWCPPGSCGSALDVCQTCAAGQYQSSQGQTSCLTCPSGTYSSSGATACTSCPTGTYQTSSGASFCLSCLPGSANSNLGATSCLECLPGSYSTSGGATACVECSAGYYQGNFNSTGCLACPVGKHSSAGASTCLNCNPVTCP